MSDLRAAGGPLGISEVEGLDDGLVQDTMGQVDIDEQPDMRLTPSLASAGDIEPPASGAPGAPGGAQPVDPIAGDDRSTPDTDDGGDLPDEDDGGYAPGETAILEGMLDEAMGREPDIAAEVVDGPST